MASFDNSSHFSLWISEGFIISRLLSHLGKQIFLQMIHVLLNKIVNVTVFLSFVTFSWELTSNWLQNFFGLPGFEEIKFSFLIDLV